MRDNRKITKGSKVSGAVIQTKDLRVGGLEYQQLRAEPRHPSSLPKPCAQELTAITLLGNSGAQTFPPFLKLKKETFWFSLSSKTLAKILVGISNDKALIAAKSQLTRLKAAARSELQPSSRWKYWLQKQCSSTQKRARYVELPVLAG